jgi:hypothetical protein
LSVAHQIEGRTRLRAQTRPVDVEELLALAGRLGSMPGIEVVDARPETGSLVVEHPVMDADGLAAAVVRAGGVIVPSSVEGASVAAHSLQPIRGGLDRVDGLLSQLTAGAVDGRTLAFVVLFSLAIRQMMAGQVMVPALSLFWWAFEMLPKSQHEAADPAGDGTVD